MNAQATFDVVVPTIGRPSLRRLLLALAVQAGELRGQVLIVDDRREPAPPLLSPGDEGGLDVTVLAGPRRGPAAARNVGWKAATAPWVAFLDDDVVPGPDWARRLARDLQTLAPRDAASQGRIQVPLPREGRPTDWERNVAGLQRARWATADMAYRRTVLSEVGGFDERFPRAYREDSDLGLRVIEAGHRIARGCREVLHPVRPEGPWVSLRLQVGNADDALMRALHGPGWQHRAGVPIGRRARHLAVVTAGLIGVAGVAAGVPALSLPGLAGWLTGTALLAWERLAPGPRTPRETATMLVTSLLIPPLASFHWVAGLVRARRLLTQTAELASVADGRRAPVPA